MPRTLVQRLLPWTLAAVFLGTMANAATAGSFLRGCAARDMQILEMIERLETTNAVSADKLRDAMHTMMHARTVCHGGYVVDALAIYDRIAQSITSNPVLSGRTQSTEIK